MKSASKTKPRKRVAKKPALRVAAKDVTITYVGDTFKTLDVPSFGDCNISSEPLKFEPLSLTVNAPPKKGAAFLKLPEGPSVLRILPGEDFNFKFTIPPATTTYGTPTPKITPYVPPAPLPIPEPRVVVGRDAIRVPPHYNEIFQLDGLRERTRAVIKVIRERCGIVDAIAVCGISGMPLLGAVSHETGIPMIIVRKPHEDLCHGYKVTGWIGSGRYIILDDLIASGRTVEHIAESLRAEARERNQVPPTLGSIVLHHLGYGQNYTMRDGASVPTYFAQRDYLPS